VNAWGLGGFLNWPEERWEVAIRIDIHTAVNHNRESKNVAKNSTIEVLLHSSLSAYCGKTNKTLLWLTAAHISILT
jgi:hypothetical protein